MEKIIKIKKISVCGSVRHFPANETARLICDLAGKQTFNEKMVAIACKLGYTIEEGE